MRRILFFAVIVIMSCASPKRQALVLTNKEIAKVLVKMTDIMVHDITNPPLAARFFSYAFLSGYEVVSQNDKAYKSMHGFLNGYPPLQKPDSIKGYDTRLSAVIAMMETAKRLQPTGSVFQQYEEAFLDSCRQVGFDENVIEQSKLYGGAVSKKILAYAKADGYNKLSNYVRYTPLQKEGTWYPTPPAFLAAVEPYFNKVRPFLLDSCSQFKPAPPVPFSKDTASGFFRQLMLNYKDTLSEERRAIAGFWDCNPFAVQDQGHLMYGFKKISPGAHWLGITNLVCEKAKKSFEESLLIHTLVSVGLMDGFICCWDEKYRSNRIRPETAIREYIDPKWEPLLQTPPFPEYLSGHSVISAASATILTHFFGDNYKYTDSVEISYGLPPRTFSSFKQAAQEAAISRFYGGIHFMDAIENGMAQGEKVGTWVLGKIESKTAMANR